MYYPNHEIPCCSTYCFSSYPCFVQGFLEDGKSKGLAIYQVRHSPTPTRAPSLPHHLCQHPTLRRPRNLLRPSLSHVDAFAVVTGFSSGVSMIIRGPRSTLVQMRNRGNTHLFTDEVECDQPCIHSKRPIIHPAVINHRRHITCTHFSNVHEKPLGQGHPDTSERSIGLKYDGLSQWIFPIFSMPPV